MTRQKNKRDIYIEKWDQTGSPEIPDVTGGDIRIAGLPSANSIENCLEVYIIFLYIIELELNTTGHALLTLEDVELEDGGQLLTVTLQFLHRLLAQLIERLQKHTITPAPLNSSKGP